MSPDASFLPPHITPPEPPEVKVVTISFTATMTCLLVLIIGIIAGDLVSEMTGYSFFAVWKETPDNRMLQPLEEQKSLAKQMKSPFELIAPKHQIRMSSHQTAIIYKDRTSDPPETPPELFIDGTLFSWDIQFGDNTWVAEKTLGAGKHVLRVAEEEADIFIDPLGKASVWVSTVETDIDQEFPEHWAWHSPHPDVNKIDRCSDCHIIGGIADSGTGNTWNNRQVFSLGAWKGNKSCFDCHREEDHQTIHQRVMLTSDYCVRCHAIH